MALCTPTERLVAPLAMIQYQNIVKDSQVGDSRHTIRDRRKRYADPVYQGFLEFSSFFPWMLTTHVS
jgi:hypothetical protein